MDDNSLNLSQQSLCCPISRRPVNVGGHQSLMCGFSVQVTSSWTSNKLFHSNPSKAELFAILPNSLLNCEHPPAHSVAQAKNKGKHYLQSPFPICHVRFVKDFWQLFHWDLCTLGFLFAYSDRWPLLSCLDAENSLSTGGQTFLLVSC